MFLSSLGEIVRGEACLYGFTCTRKLIVVLSGSPDTASCYAFGMSRDNVRRLKPPSTVPFTPLTCPPSSSMANVSIGPLHPDMVDCVLYTFEELARVICKMAQHRYTRESGVDRESDRNSKNTS